MIETAPAATGTPDYRVALLRAENRILELATRNTPLPDVLEQLALAAEELVGAGVLCSILLLDAESGRLLHGAAPSLPGAYNDAIHGIQIGPSVGSCGAAASLATEVIVADIASHPNWAPFKDLALSHGLRACWSTPILSSTGAVLATFAMYFRHPAQPDAAAREVVDMLARTAALVLERARLYDDLERKITQHKQTEDLLRTAQDAARVASWSWSPEQDSITFAPGSAEVLTVPLAQVCSLSDLLALVREEDRELVRADMYRASSAGTAFEREFGVHSGGQSRWLLLKGQGVDAQAQHRHAVSGVFLDITHRKQVESELMGSRESLRREQTERREAVTARQLSEVRFQLVLEASQIGFWYCDLPFDQLIWDVRVKEHFWFPPDQVVTITDFYDRIHPEDREPTRLAIERSTLHHQTYDTDYRTVNPATGEIKWVRAVGKTTYDPAGNPIRFDGITIDCTDRKRAEDALRASEKLAATGRLAATIAHEINNPLEAVTNFIYLARSTRDLPGKVAGYLDVADRELARVSHIAQQTLGFYRETAVPALLDIASVLDDVLLLYDRKLSYKCLQVQRRYKPGLYVTALAGELRQVVSNLLSNAIDASPEDATIHVRARNGYNPHTGEREVTITLADSGSGISAEARKRVFTPFFTTKQDVGTGLGLWVSRGIVEKHHGRMDFRSSTGAESGTVFRITLPAGPLPPRTDA